MENQNEFKGYNGQLTVTDTKLIIKRKGLLGFISNGSAGDKEIPIKSITAIQFKKASMLTNGQIQFSIQGELGNKGNSLSSVGDENTILFTKKQSESFEMAKNLIDKLMVKANETPSQVISQVSPADELKKFAELKEQGLITEDEYNVKKKEILGL